MLSPEVNPPAPLFPLLLPGLLASPTTPADFTGSENGISAASLTAATTAAAMIAPDVKDMLFRRVTRWEFTEPSEGLR